jgi:hypothetical protein
VIRSVELRGRPNPPSGYSWETVPLLIRDACVYPLYLEGWSTHKHAFTRGFETYLGEISPMYCLPLQPGTHWGPPADWPWTVEGTGAAGKGPQSVPADAFRLISRQSGTTQYVWFEKGIGPVASWSWHNGTHTEMFERLRE